MESDQGSDQGLAEGREAQPRDMVAPARARYDKLDVTKGPSFTGKKTDWANFDFKLKGFLDNHDLETTLLGQDEDKDNEDAEKRAEAQRRNRIVFAGLIGMISEKCQEGQTLLANIRANFEGQPREGANYTSTLKQR